MKAKSLVAISVLFFLIIATFQNCGGDEVAFRRAADSENPFGVGDIRKITIDPSLAENRPPIHLTTIIDNSFSTSEIQEQMNQGFAQVVDQVEGFNVVANLYTTSHSDDKSSSQKFNYVLFNDLSGNQVRLNGNDLDRVPANTNYIEQEVFGLAPSWFPDRAPLVYEFGKSSFANFKRSYFDSIANLGTAGADKEQGICTLIKKVEESRTVSDPENRAFHVYLLASNENDFTDLNSCPVSSQKETQFVTTTKKSNCTVGDPDCRFDYKIEQRSDQKTLEKISYSYQNASVKVHYSGKKIVEKYNYSRASSNHGISFQKREARYSYKVVKYCPQDNIPVPCQSSETRHEVVNGSCRLTGPSVCNASDKSDAARLFSSNEETIHSCEVSCSESWKSVSLPSNKIPNKNQLCSQSQRSCNGEEIGVVANHAGTETSHIRSCERSCSAGSINKSTTLSNKRNSCPDVDQRSCNSSEVSDIAGVNLGVSPNLVTSCQYSCTEENKSGSKVLHKNLRGCTNHPNRFCTNADREWIASKNIGVAIGNINDCDLRCTSSEKNASFEFEVSANSCQDNTSCKGSQIQQAASEIGGSVGDVSSCSVSCEQKTIQKPSCNLAGLSSGLLCSNSTIASQLCGQQGRGDIDFPRCQVTRAEKTIETTKKQVGSRSVKKLNQLDGVLTNDNIPTIAAKYLQNVHGAGGFFAGFFTYPKNDESCRPPDYLSSGDRYEELSEVLGPRSARSYPVCLEDYSPALDVVIKLAIENVLSNFNLDILDHEEVFKVNAVFIDGTEEEIPTSEYEVFKKTIRFKNKEVLKDITSLEFSIWNPNGFDE